ncbi:MAG: hypothetical protein ACR2QS_02685 [Woeseiaceae bacterium]
MIQAISKDEALNRKVEGDFLTIDDERYYVIRNIDQMKPFFMTIISSADHWLFVSSTGGLTAGRVSPEQALFPYITVDKIHESTTHTGCHTIIRETVDNRVRLWEPFNRQHKGSYEISRNLYKSSLGDKLCLEEINHELQLTFRYTWSTSAEHGLVRSCELTNLGAKQRRIEVLDGFRNVLPAGTPAKSQTSTSNLVDAYKWTELDPGTGLALFTLFSGISDRAEPCESLRANTIYSMGLDNPTYLLSVAQAEQFRQGDPLNVEKHRRGIRGAYFVSTAFEIAPSDQARWSFVADVERTQAEVIELNHALREPQALEQRIRDAVAAGSTELSETMAASDSRQLVADEMMSTHHHANVLFNVLRGGIFDHNYDVPTADFRNTIRYFNTAVSERNCEFLDSLPPLVAHDDLMARVREIGDSQLERLCLEYLPIRFGRRHGDPSRPWNHFAIRLRDNDGNRLLSYEGNWRDIFQNWEALLLSYPHFVENTIAKFVNASTADGYNPYRITKDGIDWEVEEADNPWSYIGYWGDHQIIYLQKLLELSQQFDPMKLGKLLRRRIFSFANVPYRIRPFADIWANPKSTVEFDETQANQIAAAEISYGADAKLIRTQAGDVYLVTLLEKLLITLLTKLGNTVIGGGVWMNTQRPEWNDANNALVGQGVSVVTLCYMRRYAASLSDLLKNEQDAIAVSAEVADWLTDLAGSFSRQKDLVGIADVSPEDRYAALEELGLASERYRERIYDSGFSGEQTDVSISDIHRLIDDAMAVIEFSIARNRRDDGLYQAYNLIASGPRTLALETLYPMLEGQVGVLSSGALNAAEACAVVESLFDSPVYREDQNSFMLYPDRSLPNFLQKNIIPQKDVHSVPLLVEMLARNDERVVSQDPNGDYRFNADFINVEALDTCLATLRQDYGDLVADDHDALLQVYEDVFEHRSFTGRSGGMFGFEGLGCIYWHMVGKFLLAVQENFDNAIATGAADAKRLGELYYKVRGGLGFNKTPKEYGAFPADAYSHTPGHSGARQPGLTGQVKEEILTRFGELGLRVCDGVAYFQPYLLRRREFVQAPVTFRFLDTRRQWQEIELPAAALAFTWCQVPIVYVLDDTAEGRIRVSRFDKTESTYDGLKLKQDDLTALTSRSGGIHQITVHIPASMLLCD